MKTTVLFVAGLVSALTLHIDRAFAQAPPGVFADANHPSTAPDPEKLSQIWQVDPITGQVSIMIQFGTTPQGGRGPRIPFALMYNSGSTITLQAFGSHFLPGFTPFVYQNTENYEWAPPQGSSSSGPWTTTGPFYHFYESTLPDETTPLGQTTGKGCSVRGPYIYTDENGTSHDMNLEVSETGHQSGLIPPCQDAANASDQYGASSATSDGSALQTDSGGNVTYPDGERYIAPVTTATGTLEDSNGNTASISIDNSGAIAVTDSLGRTPFSTNIPVGMTRGNALIPTGTYTVTTTGANAASEPYTVVFSSIPIGSFSMPHPTNSEVYDNTYCYSQACPTGYSVSVAPAGTTFSALTSIRLPDDESSYTFAYDPVFGTISKITFPTGGYVRFAWAVRNHGMAPHGSFEAMSDIIVTDVWTSDGSTENHWSYRLDPYSSAPPSSTVTNPDGSYVRYTGQCFIYSRVPLYLYGSMPSCKVASSATYASGGTLEQSEVETFYYSGQLYQDAATLYTSAGAAQRITQYLRDSYGNVTEKDESQFFACNGAPCAMPVSPPGGWARKTITTYLWSSPNSSQPSYNYTQAHIIDKPSQITVTDGSGNPVSMVRYNYDEGATLAGSSGVLHHDDTHYPATMVGPRGNLTSETRCAAFAGGICSVWEPATTYTYDLAGMRQSTTDPNRNPTAFSYTGSGVHSTYSDSTAADTDAYVTSITNAKGQIEYFQHSYYSGALTGHTDANLQTTSYSYADPLNRIRETDLPSTVDGTPTCGGAASAQGTTQISYNDTGSWTVTKQVKQNACGGVIQTIDRYDGLGRLTATTMSDPAGSDIVDRKYDSMSRLYSVSNPYRLGDAELYTYYYYDALGRKVQQVNPDGGTAYWCYGGIRSNAQPRLNCNQSVNGITNSFWVDELNEDGNDWQRASDGLGRMVSVVEPDGTPAPRGPTMVTSYGYDLLDNLTSVTQSGVAGSAPRVRSFIYDPLSRLLSAVNPETGGVASTGTGGITYTYSTPSSMCAGDLSLPCTRTDARNVVTTYGYDSINRLLTKVYSGTAAAGTPSSCYEYDTATNGIGRLGVEWTQDGVCSPNGLSLQVGAITKRLIGSYDAVGRVNTESQCGVFGCPTNSMHTVSYQFDLAGEVTSSDDGEFTLGRTYDGAGHLATVSNGAAILFSAHSGSGACSTAGTTPAYAAFGGLQFAAYGGGVQLNRSYSPRLLPSCESDTGQMSGSGGAGETPGSVTIPVFGTEQSH